MARMKCPLSMSMYCFKLTVTVIIVITFYLSFLGQETAKERVLESSYHLPNAHPSTTDGGDFTLFFIIAEGQAVTL